MATNITKTTQSRVFLTESKGAPNVAPQFQGCLVLGGVSQSLGDREPIYCQNPYVVGKFVTVGYTESAPDSVESSLNGRFMAQVRSKLIQVAKAGAPVDVHVHVSQTGSNPSVFDVWQSKILFEGVRFSSLDIDELGSHDEDTPINHSVDFSADAWYQLAALSFSERGATAAQNEILGVSIHYTGNLEKPPAERVLMFASTKATGGSASTPPNILYSLDSGSTWYDAGDVGVLAVADDAAQIFVVGEYVVVTDTSVANVGDKKLAYAPLTDFNGVTLPTWTATAVLDDAVYAGVTIGSVAFFAGTGFSVLKTTNISAGFEEMSGAAGEQGAQIPYAVGAYDENTVVVVGSNRTIIKTLDGENFTSVLFPVMTGMTTNTNLTAVAVLSPTIYLVGTSEGQLFYTTDGGVRWTNKSFTGTGTGTVVEDIKFATNLVGFMSHTITTGAIPHLLMTTNGGNSWTRVPTTGISSLADRINCIAVQPGEPNIVLLGGLGDDGTDGVIIVGESVAS